MRIGLIPESLGERLMLRSSRFPRPVFDVMGTMLLSRAVMAGVHFGVFERLAQEAKSADELAAEAGGDPHGMRLLLNALVACGYLTEHAGRYQNARLAADWLRADAPRAVADFVRFNYDQWNWIGHLEEFIQSGGALDIHERLNETEWRRYMLGLRDLARLAADEVGDKLKFPTAPRRLLDIGGGHCYYSIALCRRYPSLCATVVDLEPAARIGRELVEQAGLSSRIEFRTGHLAQAEFGKQHDAALLFNVLHHLDEETSRDTLRRVHAALAPGGRVVVGETFREEQARKEKEQLGSLMALFFGVTSRRETLEFEQVAGWAHAAGFARVQRQKLTAAPFSSLLIGIK